MRVESQAEAPFHDQLDRPQEDPHRHRDPGVHECDRDRDEDDRRDDGRPERDQADEMRRHSPDVVTDLGDQEPDQRRDERRDTGGEAIEGDRCRDVWVGAQDRRREGQQDDAEQQQRVQQDRRSVHLGDDPERPVVPDHSRMITKKLRQKL